MRNASDWCCLACRRDWEVPPKWISLKRAVMLDARVHARVVIVSCRNAGHHHLRGPH
jgi:hypothetical protein